LLSSDTKFLKFTKVSEHHLRKRASRYHYANDDRFGTDCRLQSTANSEFDTKGKLEPFHKPSS